MRRKSAQAAHFSCLFESLVAGFHCDLKDIASVRSKPLSRTLVRVLGVLPAPEMGSLVKVMFTPSLDAGDGERRTVFRGCGRCINLGHSLELVVAVPGQSLYHIVITHGRWLDWCPQTISLEDFSFAGSR